MKELNVCLSVEELDALKLLVKEKIAIWQVRVECSSCEISREHCFFELSLYESLLKSLNDIKD